MFYFNIVIQVRKLTFTCNYEIVSNSLPAATIQGSRMREQKTIVNFVCISRSFLKSTTARIFKFLSLATMHTVGQITHVFQPGLSYFYTSSSRNYVIMSSFFCIHISVFPLVL